MAHYRDYFAEYRSYGREFGEALSFHDFCRLKNNSKPRNQNRGSGYTQGGELQHTMGRFFLPTYDGSSKCSAKSWVEKLVIYFQLNQMVEVEAIKVAVLHLEGETHG